MTTARLSWARLCWLTIAVGLAAGCGRIGFGATDTADAATPCLAPIGHDEDHDGVDDACDVCPHIAGSQRDSDGDGVGDPCDPAPASPRERIAFFDPFTSLRPEWQVVGPATFVNDALVMDVVGNSSFISQPYTSGNDHYAFAGRIGATGTTGGRILALNFHSAAVPNYYSELAREDNDVIHGMQLTYTFDGSAYSLIDGANFVVIDIADHELAERVDHTPPTIASHTTLGSESIDLMGTIPAITPARLELSALNMSVEVDYLIDIRTE